RRREALTLHEHALTIRTRMLGDAHPKVGMSHAGVAQALLALDRADEALAHAELAVVLLAEAHSEPADLATARFALARALWSASGGRDRERARSQAEAARAMLGAAGDAALAAEIAGWLAEHRRGR
ncbi:MAG: hypothetical protein IAG13_21930, partial [Deltaproteobacteria bacterium]|nr:hypothetical protein [Nannocystaceae bacterium]